MNIYSFLIPVEDNRFLLVNTESLIKKLQLTISLKFDECHSKNFYFFPFVQCFCENHDIHADCFKLVFDYMSLKSENVIGFSHISNRIIDPKTNESYAFYVILTKTVKLSDLNLDDLEHCLFPPTNKDDVLLLGSEVQDILMRYSGSVCGDSSSIFKAVPLDCLETLSLKSLLDKVHQTDWIRMIFQKTCSGIQDEVYKTYMKYSYPCCKMGYPQFVHFMIDQKIDKNDIPIYFRCFDVTSDGFINFPHFLIAIGCMDVNTIHGGQIGELRSRYIFSYYDEDRDGYLSTFDIRKMITDINLKKNKSFNDSIIDEGLQKAIRAFDIKPGNLKVDQDTFLTVVGNLMFRGTSVLFRFSAEVSFSNKTDKDFPMKNSDLVPKAKQSNCDYVLAVHSVKVHNQGTVVNVRPIWDDIKNADQLGEFGDKFNLSFNRLNSISTFNKDSCTNEIIEALKYFRYPDKLNDKPELDWGDIKMDCLANYINILCEDVINIISNEPRLIEFKSPAYVLGDLHGNYIDLMKFEETLWRLGIGLSPGNFLFLGDYVDRGKYCLEVIAYLFSQKILNPNQVFLLRGNHEIRSIQEQFSFKNECISKFGLDCGTVLWNNINFVFDFLPVAAVIDDKLFCVHGGIPRPSLLNFRHSDTDPISSLRSTINNIPIPLTDPEIQSQLAWELMWSDPDRNIKETYSSQYDSDTEVEDAGFSLNYRRRTAYCFNQSALEHFLAKYSFSHVIRAHEVQKIGFNIELEAQLVTVFSSSHYCNSANEAACVFVNHGKLRLIRLDTG